MSKLLDKPPYSSRDDTAFLEEMNRLTQHHLNGCPPYARIWPNVGICETLESLPYLHVAVFKHLMFRTEADSILHERTLKSSATTSGVSSQITLDKESSQLQSASTQAIMKEFVGSSRRPLLILDSSRSLLARGEISARIAAAMSLQPLASEMHFLLEDAGDASSMKWQALEDVLDRFDDLLVYGFTWILWLAWGAQTFPDNIRSKLSGKRIHFVHSGGWKKLEAMQVDRTTFDSALLQDLAPHSRVIDYYGLVEQVGIIYPLCEHGYRHVPIWADIQVRDPWSGELLPDKIGQLQLMNTLAKGAPYHNVLSEDLGRLAPGTCPCGRKGRRFELLGRIPKAEIRGCANA